jgi:hypothetical protein
LVRWVSSSIRDLWDSLPRESYLEYFEDFTALFMKFGLRNSWHHLLIQDLSRPVDYLLDTQLQGDHDTYLMAHETFTSLIQALSPGLFLLLEKANDLKTTKAWLRLAWTHHRRLPAGTLTQVLGATIDLFHKGDESIIAGFHQLVSAWVEFHAELGEWIIWTEEQQEICAGLVDTYLTSAWRASPGFGLRRLEVLSRLTSEVLVIKGYQSMNKTIINSWLESWMQIMIPPKKEINEATSEKLRREGRTVLDEYRNMLSPFSDEELKNLAYMQLAEGRADFHEVEKEMAHTKAVAPELVKVNSARERLKFLKEIWLRASTEDTNPGDSSEQVDQSVHYRTWVHSSDIAAAFKLPAGWEECRTSDGDPYFVDNNQMATWVDPHWNHLAPSKNAPFPLPSGWEMRPDFGGRISYFVNHTTRMTTLRDPRLQWSPTYQNTPQVGSQITWSLRW